MRICWLAFMFLQLVVMAVRAEEKQPGPPEAEAPFAQQIHQLIEQLSGDEAAKRDAATEKLLELAGTSAQDIDHFLNSLPKEDEPLPKDVRQRLARIRMQVEKRAAKTMTVATTVTLAAKDMPLAEVLAAIEKQTGNRLSDSREQQNERASAKSPRITIDLKSEGFWSAVDQILDQAGLGIDSEGDDSALAIITRNPHENPRLARATYEGLFRLDVTDVQAERSLRQPQQKSLKLQLEVAWEPRLHPIALSHPTADLWATTNTGRTLVTSYPQLRMDVEVPSGAQAADITLPFDLPPREAKSVTALHGKLHAIVPSRIVKFRFDDLAKAAGKTQNIGGVQVSIDEVRKNNAVWEIHMRFAFDEESDALQLHRSWVFQNQSYLLNKEGQQIDNGGLETTRQAKNEVGIAYVFDVPTLDGMTWVYETPAGIVDLEVEYEIKNIELP